MKNTDTETPMNSDNESPLDFLKGKKVGDTFERVDPDDPTDHYFNFAFSIIRKHRVQERATHDNKNELLLSCISSFLSLESAINRLYFDTFEQKSLFSQKIKPNIPTSIVTHVKETWENMSIRNKYILLPPLISDYEFDTNEKPFILFDELRRFRNRLVHSKMHSNKYTFEITEVTENSLTGKAVNHSTTMPNSSSIFPITGFATSFEDLSITDSEKSFEIAYRMRLELHSKCRAPGISLTYEPIERKSDKMETMPLYFGEFIFGEIHL